MLTYHRWYYDMGSQTIWNSLKPHCLDMVLTCVHDLKYCPKVMIIELGAKL